MLRETNAASTQLLMQPGLASGKSGNPMPSAFAGQARRHGSSEQVSGLTGAAVLQQGAHKVVLAMVEKVRNP